MEENRKPKEPLIQEVEDFRRRIAELEKSETERQRAEEALRESEQRLAALIDFFPDAILAIDKNKRIIIWNRATEEMTGIPAREMIGKGDYTYTIPFYGIARPQLMDLFWEPEHEIALKYPVLKREGDNLVIEVFCPALYGGRGAFIWAKASPLQDSEGRLIGAIECLRDITEHKQAEAKLRESEERYRTAIEQSNDGIALVKGYRHIFVNQKMVEIFGYDRPEEIIGQPIDMTVHPDDHKWVKDINRRRQSGEAVPSKYEFKGRRKNGAPIYIEVSASKTIYQGEAVSLAYLRDITERKRAEEELEKSEEKYRTIIENMEDGYHEVDLEGNFTLFNESVRKMIGYEKEELLGMNYRLYADEENSRKIFQIYNQVYRTGQPVKDFEWQIIRKDGDQRDIEVTLSLIRNSKGHPTGFRGIVRDTTDRKRAEAEKRSLEERLQRAEKMEALGILAGGVAHDLNNVLGIIVGYSELLLYDIASSSPLRPGLVNILGGSQKAAAIVQDLLTLARRGISGRQVLNLNQIIVDGRNSPEFRHLSSYHPSVKIKVDLEPDLLNISGSAVHLVKTLFNLVSNASEAMPDGGILTIKTSNQYLDRPIQGYDEVKEGDYVVLSVSDTGEGVAAADLKRIFEPFYTKKVMGRSGTGLGLAVVWGTVKDHRGYISVQSEEGKGSTFTLYFPVTRDEIATEAFAVPLSEYMGKGETVLVVDDVKGQRDLAVTMLNRLNYAVTSVASGEEAVAYLKEHNVDLLVLDMIMDPGMDGLDTYRNIINIQPRQKAIIVSGFSETERVNAAQALGAGAYVKKPYVLEKLGLAVRKELDRVH